MRFGISLGNIAAPGETLDDCLHLARLADDAGFDSVWVHDHLAAPSGIASPQPPWLGGRTLGPELQLFDPLVLVSNLAVVTRRVAIGTAVLGMPYRHPAVVAKMLAAADLLSGGRIILGAGAGYAPEEFAALGLPEEHFRRRGAVTDEYIRAVKEMWLNTGPSHFHGEFLSFEDVGVFPKPLQKPHPPIVIAGAGRRAMVRASRLGNGYVATGVTPGELAARVQELRTIARTDRRDPGEVEVYLLAPLSLSASDAPAGRPPLTGSLEQVAEDLRAYARAGLQHLIALVRAPGQAVEATAETLDVLAREILPAFGGVRTVAQGVR